MLLEQHHPQIREAKPQRNATRHSPFSCQGVFLRTGSFTDPPPPAIPSPLKDLHF